MSETAGANDDGEGDPFDDPRWEEFANHAREVLDPMVRQSAVAIGLYSGKVDPKLAIELGYMILLDKPIIAVVTPGAKVPNKLALVADEIVELNFEDASFGIRIAEAAKRLGLAAEAGSESADDVP